MDFPLCSPNPHIAQGSCSHFYIWSTEGQRLTFPGKFTRLVSEELGFKLGFECSQSGTRAQCPRMLLTDHQIRNKVQRHACFRKSPMKKPLLCFWADSTAWTRNTTNSVPWMLSLEWLTMLYLKTQYSYCSCLILSRMDSRLYHLLCITSFCLEKVANASHACTLATSKAGKAGIRRFLLMQHDVGSVLTGGRED